MSEIQTLTHAVAQLVDATKTNTERGIAQGVKISTLIESTDTMVKTISTLAISNARFEEKITNLEKNTVTKIDDVEKTVIKVSEELCLLGGRVQMLELINANQSGANEVRGEYRSFWQTNWFKFVGLFVMSIPVIVGIYYVVKAIKI